jgi:hypothetical protein
MGESYFTTSDGSWFTPSDLARGPWDPTACHAGPPSGLLARASERIVDGQQLVRLTVELNRPIPHAGFSVSAKVVRAGRRVSTTKLTIRDAAEKKVAVARAMHIAGSTENDTPTTAWRAPNFGEATVGPFSITSPVHDLPMFADSVQIRYPVGEGSELGPTTAWMRTVPLLANEAMSGFQSICPLADCGNALSRNAEPYRYAFLNTDLTVVLHRIPVGEWLGSQVVSRWEPNGIGMSDALLFDEAGAVGRATQSLIIDSMDVQ